MRVYSDRMHVGAATHIGPLSIFPVWSEQRTAMDYIAFGTTDLILGEINGGDVSRIGASNDSDFDILIPQGTVLAGGLQTRVLEREALVLRGEDTVLNVRCVEQGRWGNSRHTAFDGRVSAPLQAVLRGMVSFDGNSADIQSQVWQRVSRYEFAHGRRSTGSFQSIRNRNLDDLEPVSDESEANRVRRSDRILNELADPIAQHAKNPLPGQNGVIVGLSGQPILLELFGDEAVFKQQLPSILNAALVDAPFATEEPTPQRRAIRFAEQIMATALKKDQSGELLVGSNRRVNVQSLVHEYSDGVSLHLSAINPRHELVLAL